MAKNSLIQRLLDSGLHVTEMTQSRAEGIVKDLMKQGDLRKKDAEQAVQALVERGRESAERIGQLVEEEVGRQVARLAAQLDELEAKVAALTGQRRPSGGTRRRAAGGSPTATPEPASARAASGAPSGRRATKAAAEKAAAKKAPAAKQAAAKQAAAKQAPAAKQAAAKKAAAKKAAAKNVPAAKKAPAKNVPAAGRARAGKVAAKRTGTEAVVTRPVAVGRKAAPTAPNP